MAAFTELLGENLAGAAGDGPVTTAQALEGKAAVALYFSAHWCPPCRDFTPKLAKSYSENLKDKDFEVVFVSSDKDEASFKEYFGEMPWLALPYEARDRKSKLSEQYGVQGIPTLVILDASGKTITTNGREAVTRDPTGDNFPWAQSEDVGQSEPVQRATTKQLMKGEASMGPGVILCGILCCFWVPMLFFMGAAEVLPTCESDHFVLWMRIYGTVPLASFLLMHIIATFWACLGQGRHFTNALRLQGVSALAMIGLNIWGWVEFFRISEEMCVGDDTGVNPRTVSMIWLFAGAFSPLSICLAIRKIRNPTGKPGAPGAGDGNSEVNV